MTNAARQMTNDRAPMTNRKPAIAAICGLRLGGGLPGEQGNPARNCGKLRVGQLRCMLVASRCRTWSWGEGLAELQDQKDLYAPGSPAQSCTVRLQHEAEPRGLAFLGGSLGTRT